MNPKEAFITDRHIAIRAVAQGRGPDTPVREVMATEVKYCFEDEDLKHVARNIGAASINRLKAGATAVAIALLAACATTEKAKESWVGATYDDAVRAWGAPVRSGKLADGTEVHTWVSEGGPMYRSGPSVGFGVGGFGGSGGGGSVGVGVGASFPLGQGSVAPPARCERTLSFRDGRLVEQAWIGPDEICAEFARATQK